MVTPVLFNEDVVIGRVVWFVVVVALVLLDLPAAAPAPAAGGAAAVAVAVPIDELCACSHAKTFRL